MACLCAYFELVLTALLICSAEFKECLEYTFTFPYVFMASCVIEDGENYMYVVRCLKIITHNLKKGVFDMSCVEPSTLKNSGSWTLTLKMKLRSFTTAGTI